MKSKNNKCDSYPVDNCFLLCTSWPTSYTFFHKFRLQVVRDLKTVITMVMINSTQAAKGRTGSLHVVIKT